MNEEEENLILRDLLHSTACQFTPEEWEKIQSEAAYIKFTDEGILFVDKLLLRIQTI